MKMTSKTDIFPILAVTIVSIGIGSLLATVVIVTKKRSRRKFKEFVPAGQIHDLYIYPIKSGRGNQVNWLDCGQRGAKHGDEFDRQFMLIDAKMDNLFIRARLYPKMVLVEAHRENGKLLVNFLKGENELAHQIVVDLAKVEVENVRRRARLYFDERIEGLDCGDEIARAFVEFLGAEGKRELRLIWFASEQMYTERDDFVKREHWVNFPVQLPNALEDKLYFHDCASFMGFSLASVEDINQNLAAQGICVDARNFRPNLVISGLPPFDEDCWLRVRVGQEVEFECFKPCTRCTLTTVNPDNGIQCKKTQPLKELKKYRQAPEILTDECKENPIFGVYMAVVKPGRIQIGDPVQILYKPRPF